MTGPVLVRGVDGSSPAAADAPTEHGAAPVPEHVRTRRRGSLANDERILDAGVALVAARGIDAIGLREVAAASGLTYGALYARYENVDELLADLWERRWAPELERLAAAAVAVAARPLPGVDAIEVAALLEAGPLRLGLFEALVAAARIPELGDVLPGSLGAILDRHALRPGPAGDGDPVARSLLAVALGAVAHGTLGGSAVRNAATIAGLLAARRPRVADDPPPSPLVPGEIVLPSIGSPLRDALLAATLGVVARSGRHGATLRRISRASGYSHTAVYQAYGSLDALLVDVATAAARRQGSGPDGSGVAGDASRVVAIAAGWVAPAARRRRRLLLEFWLAAVRDPRLGEIVEEADRAAFAAVADLAGAPGTGPHLRALVVRELVRDHLFGCCALEEAAGGLDGSDWRRGIGALVDAGPGSPPAPRGGTGGRSG